MNRKKIYTILASLLGGVLVIVFIGNFVGGNDHQPRLALVLVTNQEVAELSSLAKEDASNFNLQSIAATISVVAASDGAELAAFYTDNYGRPPALKETDSAATRLKQTQPGPEFDSSYLTSVRGDLELNLAAMRDLAQDAAGTELGAILSDVIANYSAHLETIKSYETTDQS